MLFRSWIWLVLVAILIFIPGTAARLLLDVLGGLTLFLLLIPVLAAGGGFLAWQLIRRRMKTCSACGTSSFGCDVCPACGAWLDGKGSTSAWMNDLEEIDPSQVIINVEAEDVEKPSTDGSSRSAS